LPLGFFILSTMSDRSISFLPAPLMDPQGREFPLCDASALAILEALSGDDVNRRQQILAATLTIDPPLAVWCAAQQRGSENEVAGSIHSLAQWTAPRLLDLLSGPNGIVAGSISLRQLKQLATHIARCVTAARHAASPEEYLTRLLSYNTGQKVAAAPSANGKPRRTGVSDSDAAKRAGLEAKERWLMEVPGIHRLLPLLVRQLQELRSLRSEFAMRLENAKLSALKEFAYGAGHELNNPLANIASRAQTLLQEDDHPERRRKLAAINAQAFRAHEMLADIMLFARPPAPSFEPVNVAQLADEVLAELADDAEAQNTSLRRSGSQEPLMVQADPTHLRVAIRALCQNSLEALGRDGNITLEVRNAEQTTTDLTLPPSAFPLPPSVEVVIADDGPGIPPEIREKIFDPFFSGREAGRGLGFGLSKCWRIVELHGGRISVESEPGKGARFTISLPASHP
jgi:signal transduction histidine kinase